MWAGHLITFDKVGVMLPLSIFKRIKTLSHSYDFSSHYDLRSCLYCTLLLPFEDMLRPLLLYWSGVGNCTCSLINSSVAYLLTWRALRVAPKRKTETSEIPDHYYVCVRNRSELNHTSSTLVQSEERYQCSAIIIHS